jgi:hypothetical protein
MEFVDDVNQNSEELVRVFLEGDYSGTRSPTLNMLLQHIQDRRQCIRKEQQLKRVLNAAHKRMYHEFSRQRSIMSLSS